MTDAKTPHRRLTFTNLAVRDLDKSLAFFRALGFEFNPHFTDEKAACLILSETSYAMLLTEPFFRGFTKREPCDTRTHTELLLAVSCGDRAEVNTLVDKALAAGATVAMPTNDMGFMYTRTFYDLDGHHWEFFHMDPSAIPPTA